MKRGTNKRSHHAPKVLVGGESSCFDDVRWKDGVASVTFAKDGAQYQYDMSRADFKEWADSGSLGDFFNAEIR
jgi:hypothetical protein